MLTKRIKRLTANCAYKFVIWGGLLISPAMALPDGAEINATGSMTPDLHEQEVWTGETLSLERRITVNIEDIIEEVTVSSAPEKLDILFLADNTDSMTSAIANVQDNAQTLLSTLSDTYGDVQFGVARYYGDPQETKNSWEAYGQLLTFTRTYTFLEATTCTTWQGETYDCYRYQVEQTVSDGDSGSWVSNENLSTYQNWGDSHTSSWEGYRHNRIQGELGATGAYELQQTVSSGNIDDAVAAINDWRASSGGDWSEGSFFALHQAATSGLTTDTGYASNYETGWRSDAKKVIVWFGDAQSHTMTLEQQEVISALEAQDISVIAIHTRSTALSETQGLDADFQASGIANATNGQYADVYSEELSDTITALIGNTVTVTNTYSPGIQLVFNSVEGADSDALAGLNISYTCIDPLGCNGIEDGDERLFRMDISANQSGVYNFRTVAENVDGAEANNLIVVRPYFAD